MATELAGFNSQKTIKAKRIKVSEEKVRLPKLESNKLQEILSELGITDEDFENYFYDNCDMTADPFMELDNNDLVSCGLLEPIFKKITVMMQCFPQLYLCYWQDLGIHKSEIILHDLVDGSLTIIANSLDSFLCRGLEHKQLGAILNDSETVDKKIIIKYEEKPVMKRSVTYDTCKMEKWPKHWQEFLTEEDYNFDNDD